MEKQFLTKEEVDAHIKTLFNESLGFCPEIGLSCSTDCVCYVKHHRYRSKKRIDGSDVMVYTVQKPFCTHVLIQGTLDISS